MNTPEKSDKHDCKWRRIADALARELSDHAYCAEHPVSLPHYECPFCRNRDAYLDYLKIGGKDTRAAADARFQQARLVTLTELARRRD